jgi:Bacterial extracellular solute-binding protein
LLGGGYDFGVAAVQSEQRLGEPDEPGSSRVDSRRTLVAALVFGVVAVVVGTMIVEAAAVRRTAAAAPLLTVRMAGSSEFFDEPAVVEEFRRNGIRVQQAPLGSQQIADQIALATTYDVANAASPDAATHIEQRLTGDGVGAQDSSPFSSPMVIVTYQPIVDLLKTLGVVKTVDKILIFDVNKYLQVVAADQRWTDIPGNGTYPSKNRILVWTTDPKYANSGGMFAAIASSAQLNGDPVTTVRPTDPYLTLVQKCFVEQGSMATHTPILLEQFLTDGMDRYPMGMFYEKDYISTRLNDQGALGQGAVLMYPNPDVIPDNTFVWWTDAGRRLNSLLQNDRVLVDLEERAGYRTSNDNVRFVRDMAGKGITVPNLDSPPTGLQIAPLPTDDNLQKLINAVEPR